MRRLYVLRGVVENLVEEMLQCTPKFALMNKIQMFPILYLVRSPHSIVQVNIERRQSSIRYEKNENLFDIIHLAYVGLEILVCAS